MVITTRRKKKRKRQAEEELHNEPRRRRLLLGSRVEVRSLEEGSAGSWRCGTVVECNHICRVVEYDHFYKDENCLEKLKQKIYVSPLLEGMLLSKCFSYRGIIRPIPPPCRNESIGLTFGLCVDAFFDDAWWEGVVFDYEDESLDDLDDRLVFFPDIGDRRVINTDELRVTQDWEEVEECWIVRGKWTFLELIEEFPNAVELAGQIWNKLRQKEGFKNNIKEWTCKVQSKWVDLVAETFSQYLDESAKQVTSAEVCNGEDSVFSSDKGILPICYAIEEHEAQGVGTAVECTANGSSSNDDNLTYSEPSLGHRTGMGLSQKRIQTPTDSESTGIWLPDILPEAKYNPEAMENYLTTSVRKVQNKGFCARDLQREAKMHLSYMGWGIDYRIRPKGKVVDYHYISPNGGKPLRSLRSACLQAMGLANCRQDPLPMVCRKDQGCASPPPPPPLCLEQDSIYSSAYKSGAKSCISGSLDVHAEPEYCPEAVSDYLNGNQGNENKQLLREKVKKHLSDEGWTISVHIRKDNRRDLYYTNPSNSATFKSLPAACRAYVKEVSERMSLPSHDKLLLQCYTKPSGSSQQSKDNPEVGTMQEKRSRDGQLKKQRNCYFPLSEETAVVSGLQLDDEYNITQSKRARQAVVPSSANRSPRTILNWLIENDVVLPRENVSYFSVEDDTVFGQGKINRNGIKCNCCQNDFGLNKFGLHVGSCYTPASARIYTKDGRSLLDCQKQLLKSCSDIYAKKRDLVLKNGDDICSVCYRRGTSLKCGRCPSTFHLNCLGLEDVPDGKWFCPSCKCRICGEQIKLDSDSVHLAEDKVLCCDQCNHKYHARCIGKRRLSKQDDNSLNSNWFCGMRCQKVYPSLCFS